MYTSDVLIDAGQNWRAAADALLSEAERIGPLEEGVFGELGTDDEPEAAARGIDEQVEALIAGGERALDELQSVSFGSIDARFQANALLAGTLAVGDALAVAGQARSDVFGDLGLEPDAPVTFTDARSAVKEAAAVVTGAPLRSPQRTPVPESLAENLEKIESTGANESWSIVSASAGQLAGGALVSGLQGVLQGVAAAAFEQIRQSLSRWRDALKRGVVRIAEWGAGAARAASRGSRSAGPGW
jgi:hypothetical protein